MLLLAEDQSGYVASILSRRARLLGLMWDLDNTPLGVVPRSGRATGIWSGAYGLFAIGRPHAGDMFALSCGGVPETPSS